MAVLTINTVTPNESYTINGIATGERAVASVASTTSLRLKKLGGSTDYVSIAGDFSDFVIDTVACSNVSDAVQKINAITNTIGVVDILNTEREYAKQQYFGEKSLTDAVNIDWDLSVEQNATVILTGNRTLNAPTNMKAGGRYVLKIVQDGVGSRTLTFNSAYYFEGGTDPTLSIGVNAIDVFEFYSDGARMLCVGGYLNLL